MPSLNIWIEHTALGEDDQFADLHALGARIAETMRPLNRDGEYAYRVEEN